MKATITINMDNAAFEELGDDLARILNNSANRLRQYPLVVGDKTDTYWPLYDSNGNKVGEFKVIQ